MIFDHVLIFIMKPAVFFDSISAQIQLLLHPPQSTPWDNRQSQFAIVALHQIKNCLRQLFFSCLFKVSTRGFLFHSPLDCWADACRITLTADSPWSKLRSNILESIPECCPKDKPSMFFLDLHQNSTARRSHRTHGTKDPMDRTQPPVVCPKNPSVHLWAGHIHRRSGMDRTPTRGFEVFTSPLDQAWMTWAFDLPPNSPCQVIHWKEGSVQEALMRSGYPPEADVLLALQKSAWTHRISKLNVLVLVTGLREAPVTQIQRAQDWVVFHVGNLTRSAANLAQASD